MTVPDHYIRKNQNVLRFNLKSHSYHEYILTKEELKNKKFSFNTCEFDFDEVVFVGEISTKRSEPTYFLDGEEITEGEFKEFDKKLSNFLLFGSPAGVLYGDTSEDGLYLAFSK